MKAIDYLSIGKPCPNCRLVAISPKLAEEWLQRNTSNRPLDNRLINRLINSLENKEWILNGETITFSNDGVLLQGQHRLHAIWQSGVTAYSYVVFDIGEANAFATYDGGKSRSSKDVLSIDKKINVKCMSALAVKLILWERGLLSQCLTLKGVDSKPSNTQILEYCRKHEAEMMQAINFVDNIGVAMPSCLALAFYLFNRIERDKCIVFFTRLKTGEMLSGGSPILAIRNEFMRRRAIAKNSESRGEAKAAKLTIYEEMAYLIKAWNAYCLGKDMKVIRFPRDESFPLLLNDKLFGFAKKQ